MLSEESNKKELPEIVWILVGISILVAGTWLFLTISRAIGDDSKLRSCPEVVTKYESSVSQQDCAEADTGNYSNY